MSLTLTPLYSSMVRQFNTVETDIRFKADFVDAVNMVLDELSNAAKLDTAIPHVESTEKEVDELDDQHSYLVNNGLVFYLVNSGYKHVRGDLAYASSKELWDEAKGDFMVMEQREDQADLEDDDVEPTGDIIGLGNLEEDE